MAATRLYIISLQRLVARLRDPYPLNAAERRKLGEVLSDEERSDAERRRIEIRKGKEFMTLPINHPGWPYYHDREKLTEGLRDAITLATRDTKVSLKRIAKYEAEVEVIKRAKYVNKTILLAAQTELTRWQNLLESYVDSVAMNWERTPEDVRKRFFDHKGSFSLRNLPSQHGDPERWFFPDEPASERQGFIEVLEAKIDRLSSA